MMRATCMGDCSAQGGEARPVGAQHAMGWTFEFRVGFVLEWCVVFRSAEDGTAGSDYIRHGDHGGRACIRGMWIPVSVIVGQFAHGASEEEILGEYAHLEAEDVRQALVYAAEVVRHG